VTNEEVLSSVKSQEDRFELYCKVLGTRDNHIFLPISQSHLKVKRVSEDDSGFTVSLVLKKIPEELNIVTKTTTRRICFMFMILSSGSETCQVNTTMQMLNFFTHMVLPNLTTDDKCWVPSEHILSGIT
jgi:arginine/lysine/ornithine decarboxylase